MVSLQGIRMLRNRGGKRAGQDRLYYVNFLIVFSLHYTGTKQIVNHKTEAVNVMEITFDLRMWIGRSQAKENML